MGKRSTHSSVIISGAAGYVGSHVVRAVADLGFEPIALVRPGRGEGLDHRARIVEADLFSPGFDVREVIEETTVSFVHLAWEDGFVHNAPSHMTRLSSHFALLSAVADAGVPRISALGTMHEVGYWEGAITEETPTNPRSLYGIAKDALRRSAQLALAESSEFAWLRCYYIYGDDRRNNSIFTRLLNAVDEGRSSMPFTSGKNLYDFIHVDELADQIALASVTEGVTGVVNCCTGTPISLAEAVEGFIADNRLPISLEYGAFPDRPYDSPGVWGDAEQIRAIIRTSPYSHGG